MNDQIEVTFGDIGKSITGKTPSSADPEDFGEGYPFVTPTDSLESKYVLQTVRQLSPEGLRKLRSKALPPDSVLVSCIGSAMGKVVMNSSTCITNQQFNSIIVDTRRYCPHYVYYALRNSYRLLRNAASGSTALPMLNKTDFEKLKIRVFKDKEHQRRIANVLSALDDKIALNHQINAELEAMAKLLYDYWFVQFDFPISAAQAAAMGKPKLEGKPYRTSGGPMVFNPDLKREIPLGWKVGNLLDVATFTNGIACQKYPPTSEKHLRVIKIKEMRDGFSKDSENVTLDVPPKIIVRDGDILFSWSASLEVMLWTGGTGALNQHIFKVTSDTHPRSYCYFTLRNYLQHFKMLADLRKTTMGHITREHLEQSRIAIPPDGLANEFESLASSMFESLINNQQQTQELTSLRDWLLPMLMNGQVTVG